jgi:BMFP domain-containing protein YqiC
MHRDVISRPATTVAPAAACRHNARRTLVASAFRRRAALNPQLQEVAMLNPKMLEELSSRFSELIAASPARDLEKNAKAMASAMFSRLDLVTREEFDVQKEVLARTRAHLEALEARVAELESRMTQRED